VFGAGGLRHVASGLRPPLASPAPMVRRSARQGYSALGSGFGSRHRVFHLSLSYTSPQFSFSLDRQTIELLHPFSFAFTLVGSLPSSSIVSPPQPPNGVHLRSLNPCVQELLRLCSRTICGEIDHMYIYRET